MVNSTQSFFTNGKKSFQNFFVICSLLFMTLLGYGQTNPTPQAIPYSQNFGTATFTTMPTGTQSWNGVSGATVSTLALAESSAPNGNAAIAAQTAATTTGGSFGLMNSSNGRFYVQTSSNTTNGANQLVLAINTEGYSDIDVNYNVEIISAQPRTVGIVLQYRLGTSGLWTTVSGTGNPYSQAGGTTGIKASPSLTLPSNANDQPVVQIRWATWRGTQAGNSSGIAIDNIVVEGTAIPSGPTVTTTSNSGLEGTVDAYLTGTINANGTTTDASFEYGTTVAYEATATATPSPVTGTTTTDIDAYVSSLTLNTLYHYRAVGTVGGVPTNGANLTFYTLAATPGVLAISNPQFTTLAIAIDATTANGNPSATEYAIQETGGQYVQANGSLGAIAVWQTATAWATTTVTGLTASTTYTFQVKARNGANVETSFGTTNSGTTLSPVTADYNVVQFPNTTQNITEGTSFTVFIRAYEDGITNLAGSSPRLKGWVGYSSTNDNPANAGWTWIPATFNVQVGNDDEYQADIPGSLSPGTYYYAARFEIDDSTVYTYGGAGGNWNNNNVTLNVNADVVDFANIQFPTTATLTEGEIVTVFAQVFEPGITPGAGAGAGITAEIGYSSTNTTPDGTWTWLPTTYNTDLGNNDEYQADLGAGLTPGTYYYASRFIKTGSSTYVYGGTAGIWNNDSGVLTVEALGTPVAIAASAIGVTSFTANWDAVDGATGYAIDVYEQTTAFATDLFISEYVEGSSNNKYIEIFNGTGVTVDLSDYELRAYNNGVIIPTNTNVLSGTLANGATVVYSNSAATIYLGATTNASAVGFNGDDAIALYKISTTSFVDVFGRIGDDPGTQWTGAGGYSTLDKTLVRKSNVIGGVTLSPTGTGVSAFTTLTTEWDLYNIDTVTNLGSHTFNGGSSTTYVLEDVNVGNVTSYEVTGLNSETTYFYVVRAVLGAITSANSNEIEVATLSGTCTWNGTAWSNGAGPTFEIDAILEGAYDTSVEGGFIAKSLTVSTGGSLTIGADTSVTVVNALTNELTAAAVVINSDGSLIQQGTTNTNSGNVTVFRNSQDLMRLDYTMWSSPVAAQNLADFSPFTTSNRFYTYTTDTDIYTPIANTNGFSVGQGYLIRTPNNHPTTPTSWLGQFIGLPNSGDLTVGLFTAGQGFNLVGNPYPSPISISTLLSENNGVIGGNLYFWRKTNGATGSAYVTYSGGTFSDGPHEFNNIQPGQGFIVQALSGAGLSFANTQRQSGNGDFYRNGNITQSEDNSRIWLNVTANNAVIGQMAIGYNASASNDLDVFDAAYINDNAVALNSFVANTELAVQHRAEFAATDVVPLSFKTTTAGSYAIAINAVDGLFTNVEQSIFLKDNLLAIEHDLRSSSYNFTAEVGSFTNRFEIIYQSTLGVTTPELANQTIVFAKDNQLHVQSSSSIITGIQVFDVQGRLVLDVKDIHSTSYAASLEQLSNGVLFVKVVADHGMSITKKIIK
ncbi:lamin tail domain-containing protein [Flavobacterium lacus]|uniref:Putative secreted protein (Por secretion system target) n=1 Tax=Flavobacterium lacus TaxID=1353778 RepID=A0A328WKW3_9FLAO|nr:lamin tail domain-containing protein [Flavobacterium lacus]RAR46992.1 putative secreted protein (Por secretion system target) [Flavobacterium lacus]